MQNEDSLFLAAPNSGSGSGGGSTLQPIYSGPGSGSGYSAPPPPPPPPNSSGSGSSYSPPNSGSGSYNQCCGFGRRKRIIAGNSRKATRKLLFYSNLIQLNKIKL